MKRLMTLCIMLTAVALISAPAFAEVQNVKVSGDIDSKMIYRADSDFMSETTAAGTNVKDSDAWFMTTTRVRIDADLTDNVSTVVRLVNERDWSLAAAAVDDIRIDLANVTLKECFYSPLTLTIGRQNLRFGNALVVGDPDTNDADTLGNITAVDLSVNKSFDAVRATLDYSPTTVDVIYAKINANTIGTAAVGGGGVADPRDDIDLWGVNVAYDFANDYDAVVEGYVFVREDRSQVAAGAGVGGGDVCNVWGVNGSLVPLDDLLLSGELAYQNGDFLDTSAGAPNPNRIIDRKAHAFDIAAIYDGLSEAVEFLPALSLKAAYSLRSGQSGLTVNDDISNTQNEYNAWDPMFEDQTHGIIANRIFNGLNDGVDSNGRIVNIGASAEPLEDLTVSLDYYFFRLDQEYNSNNTVGQNRTMGTTATGTYAVTDEKELGTELDIALDYAYTEDVTMGLVAGWFFPGDTFNNTPVAGIANNNDTATEVIASVAVAF